MTTPKAPAGWNAAPLLTARQALPQFELMKINQHGAVFRSGRAYEPGTAMAFGIHLPHARRNRLFDLNAIVVDCRPTGTGRELGWEVTLIFESVTPAQVSALRAAARLSDPAGPFPMDGSFFGEQRGFREPGLN